MFESHQEQNKIPDPEERQHSTTYKFEVVTNPETGEEERVTVYDKTGRVLYFENVRAMREAMKERDMLLEQASAASPVFTEYLQYKLEKENLEMESELRGTKDIGH